MNTTSVITEEENVFESCQALQVYPNECGDIVLRQKTYPEDDVFVVIPVFYVEKVITAIRAAKKDAIELRNA